MTPMERSELCDSCLARPAERLVLFGLRGWLAGYETGDIACWEAVWNEHARTLSPRLAKPVVTELSALVRSLRSEACRTVAFYPPACRMMCRDECLVLGLLTGCQIEAWTAAGAAASQLAGGRTGTAILGCGRDYAAALAAADLRLGAIGPAALAAAGHLPAAAGLN